MIQGINVLGREVSRRGQRRRLCRCRPCSRNHRSYRRGVDAGRDGRQARSYPAGLPRRRFSSTHARAISMSYRMVSGDAGSGGSACDDGPNSVARLRHLIIFGSRAFHNAGAHRQLRMRAYRSHILLVPTFNRFFKRINVRLLRWSKSVHA